MKILIRYTNLCLIILSTTFLLAGCGAGTQEKGGTVTIQSSPFTEIKPIASKVNAYLEVGGKTCEFELDPNDTTLKDDQKCSDIPMGSHPYKIVYKFKDTGVVLANTEGTINLISGKDNEIYLAPPEKDIDDDGDGFKNFYEVLQGTNPKDSNSKPVEDKTPPAVNSTNPANSSTNIPVNSKISATFSEAIDSKTITNETFTVSNGSTSIPGTVSLNDMTATFTPTGSLSYNTTYTATIGTGVKDLAGNAITSNYSWSFSTEISSGTKPSAPTGVTTKAGDTQITISWNAVSGATYYNIYWSTSTVVTKTTGTKISNVKSPYLHTGLTNGTTYRYVVTAVNSYGESGESDQTSAKYTSVVTLDTTAPANTTGTNFISSGASASNSTAVTLIISATDSVGVTGYYASENSTTPSASDAGWTSISSTTTYSAGVTFTLSSGDGAKTIYVWFKDAVGNVSNPVSDSITLATIPSAPTNVISAASDAQATIRWDTVSNATSYNIYWSATSGVTKSSGTKIHGIISTSYTHTGLTNGTTYFYVVTAVNNNGESSESVEVTATPLATVHLPKTGQTTCYDSSGSVIACAGTGQDGELQKGVAWPNPRFTDNGNGTVADNLTGLVWTKDANVPGPAACSPGNTKTWQDALDYVACLNTNSYLGYTDWRLPNLNELKSLVHAGQSNTATWLNTQGFNNVSISYYWSSSTFTKQTGRAWIVYMLYGYIYNSYKSDYNYVWPVRSGQSGLSGNSTISIPGTEQTTCYDTSGNVINCTGTGQDGELQKGVGWPIPRFTDNGNSTVTDNLTGLIWTKDAKVPGPAVCSSATTKTYQAALNYVVCLNANSFLGYTDWRLPNVNEIRSLIHVGQSNTATWLNTQGIDNIQTDRYWTSTYDARFPSHDWVINMGDGYMFVGQVSDAYYVWPVRSGQ